MPSVGPFLLYSVGDRIGEKKKAPKAAGSHRPGPGVRAIAEREIVSAEGGVQGTWPVPCRATCVIASMQQRIGNRARVPAGG